MALVTLPSAANSAFVSAQQALARLEQLVPQINTLKSVPVGKPYESPALDLGIHSFGKEGPYYTLNEAYKACFQEGNW
jgi:hypothetical protein